MIKHGDISVPCEECGHMNTLRQTGSKPVSEEERFITQVQKIVSSYANGEVAYTVAGRILALFNPNTLGKRPSYRIQVHAGGKWHTIDGLPLTHLLCRITYA